MPYERMLLCNRFYASERQYGAALAVLKMMVKRGIHPQDVLDQHTITNICAATSTTIDMLACNTHSTTLQTDFSDDGSLVKHTSFSQESSTCLDAAVTDKEHDSGDLESGDRESRGTSSEEES